MVINSRVFAAALIFAVTASPAVAGSFYGALDVGQSKGNGICSSGFGGADCKETASLYRVGGGYQFTPMWGAEASYGNYGKATTGVAGDWKMYGVQLSAIGTFHITDDFSLLGKLGFSTTELKDPAGGNGHKTALDFGIGAQYDFTKSFAVRAQYEDLDTVEYATPTGVAKIKLLSTGVVYKF